MGRDSSVIKFTHQFVDNPVAGNITIVPQDRFIAQPVNISFVISISPLETSTMELSLHVLSYISEELITVGNAPTALTPELQTNSIIPGVSPSFSLTSVYESLKSEARYSPTSISTSTSTSTCGMPCCHELLRSSYLQNVVLSSLPGPSAEWISNVSWYHNKRVLLHYVIV